LEATALYEMVQALSTTHVAAMHYLTHTRGLHPDVIEKFGVGAMTYKFPNEAGVLTEHVCITFPWIRPATAPPVASTLSTQSSVTNKRGRAKTKSSPTAAATAAAAAAAEVGSLASNAETTPTTSNGTCLSVCVYVCMYVCEF
jgi:hypothetical protein